MKKLFLFTTLISTICFAQQKIPLKVSDAYQTNHVSEDVSYLIDDDSTTRFNPTYPGNNTIFQPHDVIFDLSDYDPCTVKSLVFYDANGAGYDTKFYLVKKSDNTRHLFYTFDGGTFNTRQTISIPTDSQFVASKLIIETAHGGDEYPNYIQLWGTYTLHNDPVWNRPKSPLKNFLMSNCHPWDIDSIFYPHKYQALVNSGLHGVRLYSDIYADKDSATGSFQLNPEGRGFQPERTFAALLKLDSTFIPQICYQGQTLPVKATWTAHGQGNAWYKYWGTDSTLPTSYDSAAFDMYVLSLRGGRSTTGLTYNVTPQAHWYDSANVMIKGGNFYKVIEGGNEWDGWYTAHPEYTYMGGNGLAAAWSAMYDGDKGAMGAYRGVKTANTDMKFTNAGIAWDKPDLFREAVEWWRTHRGLVNGKVDIPLDVFSYHLYSGANGGQYGSSGGLNPELGMVNSMKQMVYFSNKYGNGLPIAIGEWGWDVNPSSILNAPAYGSYSAQQTRGNWGVRAILLMMQEGIDYAQWYRLYQDYYTGDPLGGNYISDNNTTQFATMALLRQNDFIPDSVTRTTVGDYFAQLSEFSDYTLDAVVRNDSVHVLRLTNGINYLYAIWSEENVANSGGTPSFIERTGTVSLAIVGNYNKRQLTDGADMMSSNSETSSGITSFSYSSKPLFIETPISSGVLPTNKFFLLKKKCILLSWDYDNNVDIQRGSDGVRWTTLARDVSQKNYQDCSPLNGMNYYRLKYDIGYSEIRAAFITQKPVQAIVYNSIGQLLEMDNNIMDTDRFQNGLKSGFYIINYSNNEVNYTSKLYHQ